MLKKDTRYHYGIKKHTQGSWHEEDCWVLGADYLPLKYIYRASADFICSELTKAHSGRVKFYVARCD